MINTYAQIFRLYVSDPEYYIIKYVLLCFPSAFVHLCNTYKQYNTGTYDLIAHGVFSIYVHILYFCSDTIDLPFEVAYRHTWYVGRTAMSNTDAT